MAGEKKEKMIKKNYIFQGRMIKVRVDDVPQQNGETAKREVVEHGEAVAILAFHDDGRFYLVKQQRYAIGNNSILEIPAGMIDEGEIAEEAAIRELQEEIGFAAKKLERLLTIYTSPGFTDERITIFRATELYYNPLAPDEHENIEVVLLTTSEGISAIARGEIEDAKTIAALSYHLVSTFS